MKQLRSLVVGLGLLGSVVTGCAGRMPALQTAGAAPGVSVSGHGEVRVAPDLAVLSVGVEVHRRSMTEARDAAAATAVRVLEAARAQGVAGSDVQTAQLSFQPEYDYGEAGRRLVGYVASNSMRVRVTDLGRVSGVVDAVVTAAGDDARVDGVSFELTDPTPHLRAARERAIEDARAKAEELARSLGVRLGEPVAVEEGGGPAPGPMMRMDARVESAATPVSPGELAASVDVTVRWSLR